MDSDNESNHSINEDNNETLDMSTSKKHLSSDSKLSAFEKVSPSSGNRAVTGNSSSVKRLPFSVDSLLAKTTKRRSTESPSTSPEDSHRNKSRHIEHNDSDRDSIESDRRVSAPGYLPNNISPAYRPGHSPLTVQVASPTSHGSVGIHPALRTPQSPYRNHTELPLPIPAHSISQSHSPDSSSVNSYSDDEDLDAEIDIEDGTIEKEPSPGKENSYQTYSLNVSGLIDKERFGRVDGAMGPGGPGMPLGWSPHLAAAMPWMAMPGFPKPGRFNCFACF